MLTANRAAIVRRFVFAVLVVVGCAHHRSTSRPISPCSKSPPLDAAGWLNGPAPESADLDGNVVVVDVWAFW